MKFFILTGAIAFFASCSGQNDEPQKTIGVTFSVDDSLQKIDDNFKVFFINNKDTLKARVMKDSFQLPSIKDSSYDIIFMYRDYNLLFDRVPKTMLIPKKGMGWEFRIDNRPFNFLSRSLSADEYKNDSAIRQFYYLKFDPEGMDGITIVRKRN